MHICSYLATIEADPFANVWSLSSSPILHSLGYWLGLPYLPFHAHEVLVSASIFSAIYVASGIIAPRVTPLYTKLSPETKAGFSNHVVSEVNAIILLVLSFPLFFTRNPSNITSYTPYSAFVCSVCVGYFLWDLFVSAKHVKSVGWGFLLHAVAALFTFAQAMRPFMLNYAAPFIWFEASTSFVNVHWYATNVPGLVSKTTQFYNGVALIIVFLLCRIIPGPINGYHLFYEAIFQRPAELPLWIVVVELSCYLSLVGLNFYWFGLMMKVAYETLTNKTVAKDQTKAPMPASTPPVSTSTGSASKTKAHKRKV